MTNSTQAPTVVTSRRALLAGSVAITAAGLVGLARPALAQSTTPSAAKRIVFVVSNPAKSPTNGMDIGFWLPELAHPWWAFNQKGYQMTIASPKGGAVMHDKISDPDGGRFANPADLISLGFKSSKPTREAIENTKPLSDIKVEDFDAIFVVGGLAPPVTFTNDEALHNLFAAFYDAGKLSVAICHGSLVLLKARLASGKLLAEGKNWTGYCNLEEDVVDKAMGVKFQPYRIEDEANKIPGTKYVQGAPYKPFAVTDGRLITGQQGSSGMLTAEHVIKVLG